MNVLESYRNQIIANAWEDPTFRSLLVSNPKKALASVNPEIASAINDVQNIKVLFDDSETIHFVLPVNPSGFQELSNEFLDKIADVEGSQTMKDPNCATKSYTRPCSPSCK